MFLAKRNEASLFAKMVSIGIIFRFTIRNEVARVNTTTTEHSKGKREVEGGIN